MSKKKRVQQNPIWSPEEEEILKQMVLHYGEDFKLISRQMNELFQYDKMTANKCTTKWHQEKNPSINWGPLTEEEASKLFNLFLDYVSQKGCLWVKLKKNFKNRPGNVLQQRFRSIIVKLLRRLNLFFGESETQKHYHARFGQLSIFTVSMIFFLAKYEPKPHEYSHIFLDLIFKACKQLLPMIAFFFEYGLTNKEDLKYYFEQELFGFLPEAHSFSNMIEPIFLLDSLNKINFASRPYDYGQQRTKAKTTKIAQKLQQAMIKQYGQTKEEVPTNQLLYKIEPRFQCFVELSQEQVEMILNSDIAKAILPLQMRLFHWKKY